ncbi:histone H1-gamma, late-like [Lytechinus variegatus]|uniref:histone H1-gamma, late-like n=1 Tax=Lytechinus variegatus TaxID=7654 RepID=UPI001BB294E8|nr:histone H1-gamma, late-like [Lytechinus variegatus]
MSSDDDLEIPNGDVGMATKASKSTSHHPKYNEMVVTAIKALDEKKGASVIAIKQWIIQRYPEIDQSRMKNLLRMALKRCDDSGAIVRPNKKYESMGTMTGRYKLGKPPKPVKKVVKKKAEKKKASATGKKKVPKSPAGKKDRKKSDNDIFDYEDDTEGSDPDGGRTPPPYRKNPAKKQPANRPRSASASATPKPRVSKSKAIHRRSKSQSPAPSRFKKTKKPASKSPAKKPVSKSPAKKASSLAKKSKAKPAVSPAATGKGKAKKPSAKNKEKTPTKKAAKPTKKKTVK